MAWQLSTQPDRVTPFPEVSMFHSSVLPRFRFLLLPAFVVACSSSTDSGGGGQVDAGLRAVHVSPAVGPIDVLVDGTPVITGLTYGSS
jgi:hypothetical protein